MNALKFVQILDKSVNYALDYCPANYFSDIQTFKNLSASLPSLVNETT
jgi:hypothetical protein